MYLEASEIVSSIVYIAWGGIHGVTKNSFSIADDVMGRAWREAGASRCHASCLGPRMRVLIFERASPGSDIIFARPRGARSLERKKQAKRCLQWPAPSSEKEAGSEIQERSWKSR